MKASVPGGAEIEYSHPAGWTRSLKMRRPRLRWPSTPRGRNTSVPGAVELKVVAFDYILLGDFADADKWLTRALQSTPEDAEGWYYLADEIQRKPFRRSDGGFQRCLKMDGASLRAEYDLACYQGLGRPGTRLGVSVRDCAARTQTQSGSGTVYRSGIALAGRE